MTEAPAFKPLLLAGSLLAAACLSACGQNVGLSSLKTPTVATQLVYRDIAFGPDNRILPDHAEALQAFLAGMKPDYGTRLMLEDGSATGAAERRAAVAGIVAAHGGVLAANAPASASSLPEGTVRLWIERAQAVMPVCPDWSDPEFSNMNASSHSNYGCAVNSNLAAMVADPGDLSKGRAYDGPSGPDIAKDQATWRKRTPTGATLPLEKASTTNAIRTGGGGGGN